MPTVISQPLLWDSLKIKGGNPPPASILAGLTQLAEATDSLPERSHNLYTLLRKQLGQAQLADWLRGIQHLACGGDSTGARLLAAFLEANTPGARLIPRISTFASSRRLFLDCAALTAPDPELGAWRDRFKQLQRTVLDLDLAQPTETAAGLEMPDRPDRPGREPPFPQLRRCLRYLVSAVYRNETMAENDRELLVALTRLEADAYEERISRLAGQVNPYRATAVTRVLPLLSQADTDVRDLYEFIGWIEAGDIEQAFHQRRPRLYEVLEPNERTRLLTLLKQEPDLELLAQILESLLERAVPVSLLAGHLAHLLALTHELCRHGVRKHDLDLLTATVVAQQFSLEGELRLLLDSKTHYAIAQIMAEPRPDGPLAHWPLDGFQLLADELVLPASRAGEAGRNWPDDLPSRGEGDSVHPVRETPPAEQEASIKKLVLNNLGSVSVLIGFLRNPKIVGVPGLVAEVAARCRSLMVLDVIATDRTLYTGFANREVPLTLLRSPCNISIKKLRKFIQVKYVNKVDLKRMANDKAGIRDEVVKEIDRYLRTLV
ncbi:MAG: hypothetical protein ABIF77_06100 [bacterium]